MNDKIKMTYEGHRNRLRKRFEKSGFHGLHNYEILELLLTYAIPRKNTKPVAKSLIAKFKTIQKILDVSPEKLREVEGIGENSAMNLWII